MPSEEKKLPLKKPQYSVNRQYTLMSGSTSAFAVLVKTEALHAIVTHCFVHPYASEWQDSQLILKETLSVVVKVFYCFISAKLWIIACARTVMKKICCESCQIHKSQDFQSRRSQEILSRKAETRKFFATDKFTDEF